MSAKFWAAKGKKTIGPCDTREEAVRAFRATQKPVAAYMARARANQIMSGYGEFGPHFDIQFHDAASKENAA